MTHVLTDSDNVTCTHQGTAAVTTASKLRVAGAQVLTGLGAISGCTNTVSPNLPCTAAGAIIKGTATKLKVGGAPVLLDSLNALVQPPGVGTLSGTATKTKLSSV